MAKSLLDSVGYPCTALYAIHAIIRGYNLTFLKLNLLIYIDYIPVALSLN